MPSLRRIPGGFWFVVQVLTGIYLFTAIVVWLCQAKMVFYPTRTIEATPSDAGLAYEDVWLRTADGVRLNGWFIPAGSPRGVALFFHGNGGNLGHRIDTFRILHRLGFSTFMIDYRGYGRSEGTLSENGTYHDAEAAWRYLTDRRGIDPSQIVVMGRSLGGVFSAYLASRFTPAGAVIESSLTSVTDIGSAMYPLMPVRRLSRIHYPTIDFIAKACCPVLVMHSREDDVIPFSHGERLFEAAPQPKEFLELIGPHNDGYKISGPLYSGGLDAFAGRVLGG